MSIALPFVVGGRMVSAADGYCRAGCAGGGMHARGEAVQRVGKLAGLPQAQPGAVRDARRDMGEVVLEGPAPFGEGNDDDALVLRTARALQETRLLHPPQQRRGGARGELQALAEIADGPAVTVP